MKPGARALGVAASDGPETSTLCGALVRADRVVDGLAFDACAVGGTDATDAVISLFSTLGREDVRYLLLAGVAPAWFNVLDLRAIAEATDRPTLSVSFEASEGLEPALREQFDGRALRERLDTYRAQPARRAVAVGGETRYVRAVGVDGEEAAAVVRGFTPEGGRPEPLRVARLAARAGREFAASDAGDDGATGDTDS